MEGYWIEMLAALHVVSTGALMAWRTGQIPEKGWSFGNITSRLDGQTGIKGILTITLFMTTTLNDQKTCTLPGFLLLCLLSVSHLGLIEQNQISRPWPDTALTQKRQLLSKFSALLAFTIRKQRTMNLY
jgi:hypothetical protein